MKHFKKLKTIFKMIKRRPKSAAIALIICVGLFCMQSCSNSEAGGTTAGNPLESSLPQQISADVQ